MKKSNSLSLKGLRLALVSAAAWSVMAALAGCAGSVSTSVGIDGETDSIRRSAPAMVQNERILLGISAEGASVVAYDDAGDIRRIEVEALGERGKVLGDYYYRDGELIYARKQRIDYGADIMEQLDGVELREEVLGDESLYFDRGTLVRWLRFGALVDPAVDNYQLRGGEISAEAESFLRLMETASPQDAGDACLWSCAEDVAGSCSEYVCDALE